MAKEVYMNFNEWAKSSGIQSEQDLLIVKRRVRRRLLLYSLLCLIPPMYIFISPFWIKTLYLSKTIKYRDLNVEPGFLAKFIFGIFCIASLFVYPFIMLRIITKTNIGMGINNWGKKDKIWILPAALVGVSLAVVLLFTFDSLITSFTKTVPNNTAFPNVSTSPVISLEENSGASPEEIIEVQDDKNAVSIKETDSAPDNEIIEDPVMTSEPVPAVEDNNTELDERTTEDEINAESTDAGTMASGGSDSDTISIWTGSGTADDPYLISEVQELYAFADAVNNDAGYSDAYFKLTNDIYINDTTDWENWETNSPHNTWTPIGISNNLSNNNTSQVFQGIFDGNFRSIYGLYIDGSLDNAPLGLFGIIKGATIANVTVAESFIRGTNTAGGIAGISQEDSTIIGCCFSGRITGKGGGGIAGMNFGEIDCCWNTGNLICTSEPELINNVLRCMSIFGGIAASNSGKIWACYNTGYVDGAGIAYGNYNTNAIISNCYNTGTVRGFAIALDIRNDGRIEECYNIGYNTENVVLSLYFADGDEIVQNNYNLAGSADNSMCTLLTEAEMMNATSFINWDFDKTWAIGVFDDYPYPTLNWQIVSPVP